VRALRSNSYIVLICSLFFFLSCSKDGGDFIDSTADFPTNWKMDNSSEILAYNSVDSIRSIRNTSVIPFGTNVNSNFGTFRSSFYASYQTSLSSKSFSFNSIDSIVLIIPYLTTTPKYGPADKPFSVEVYEMTESIEPDPNSKKISYSVSPTILGSLSNFIPNIVDSFTDLGSGEKTPPAIRIKLNNSLASKIIAPGSYASDVDFQNVLKGLYVKSSANTSTNGFVLLSISSDNRIRIYGKNASGEKIISDFTTGGSNTFTVNEYLHDKMSIAYTTSKNANQILGDNIIYSHGLNGYIPTLVLPDLSNFSKSKSIFKAELSLYSLDVGIEKSNGLGIMYLDSLGTKEFALPDELYKKAYLISIRDTSIGGNKYVEYKYNIGMFINRMVSSQNASRKLRVYSAPLVFSNSVTKFSDFLPSSTVLGGTGNIAKPKLKLFYTDI